jgi:hypothetical protein
MRTKKILLLVIVVELLIVWLIAGWIMLAAFVAATSALTWLVTASPALLDGHTVTVIDGQTWIDGAEYRIR